MGGAGENVLEAIYQTQELRDLFMFLAWNVEKLIFPKILTLDLDLDWVLFVSFKSILIGYHLKYLYLLINVL